jgi:hypothetical protein
LQFARYFSTAPDKKGKKMPVPRLLFVRTVYLTPITQSRLAFYLDLRCGRHVINSALSNSARAAEAQVSMIRLQSPVQREGRKVGLAWRKLEKSGGWKEIKVRSTSKEENWGGWRDIQWVRRHFTYNILLSDRVKVPRHLTCLLHCIRGKSWDGQSKGGNETFWLRPAAPFLLFLSCINTVKLKTPALLLVVVVFRAAGACSKLKAAAAAAGGGGGGGGAISCC